MSHNKNKLESQSQKSVTSPNVMEANENKADLFIMCCWLMPSLGSVVMLTGQMVGTEGKRPLPGFSSSIIPEDPVEER